MSAIRIHCPATIRREGIHRWMDVSGDLGKYIEIESFQHNSSVYTYTRENQGWWKATVNPVLVVEWLGSQDRTSRDRRISL